MLTALLALGLVLLPLLLLGFAAPRLTPASPIDGTRLAQAPGGVVRYQDVGAGARAVVFLHGFNQHLGHWDDAWARLDGCPVRRVRLDVPGFGASVFATDDYSLPRQAERVTAVLDQLGVHQATLVGTSMGGSLAVWLAAAHPDRVEQLALLAPSGYTGALQYPGYFGLLVKPGPLNRAATWLARTGAYAALFPRSAALQALTTTASYGPAWVEQLAAVRAPVFLAWSKADQTAHVESARAVASALKGSTLFWLDASAAHSIPSTRPDFTALVACRLGRGVAPEALARELPASVLRPGEGPDR
jgi:pimeloyl-ACP methyl ester carboxylesterase